MATPTAPHRKLDITYHDAENDADCTGPEVLKRDALHAHGQTTLAEDIQAACQLAHPTAYQNHVAFAVRNPAGDILHSFSPMSDSGYAKWWNGTGCMECDGEGCAECSTQA